MTADQIGEQIARFVAQPRANLFAGAGVGCRVGFPSWCQWLEGLAGICRKYHDDLAAQLIEQRVKNGDYLGAAVIYKTSKAIPAGEQLAEMAAPFRNISGDLELLRPLISLPIESFVTPNYDRSLHEACARFRGCAVRPLELHDRTLRNGAAISELFVARIHGRAEMPESMISDTFDYEQLARNRDYEDFLVSILRQRPTLFIGFSFLDPAINSVLTVYRNNFGPHFPQLHLALIPEDDDPTLKNALLRVNFHVLTYDSTEDHKDVWRAIRLAQENAFVVEIVPTIEDTITLDAPKSQLHRVIAFAYARIKTPPSVTRPVLEMVQDGVLLSILADEPSSHLEKSTAIDRLRDFMRLDQVTAEQIFHTSLQRLKESGDVKETGRFIHRAAAPSSELDSRLTKLVHSVTDRMKIIYGKTVSRSDEPTIRLLWEQLFIVRSWDLAPQYAGSVLSKAVEIEECVANITGGLFQVRSTAKAVQDTVIQIINYPEKEEAEALAEISRAAITVQLLLSSPRHALAHEYTLPGKIYFDASVLLPAIAPGHPMQAGNLSAIARLQTAAKNVGRRCELAIGYEFLDEILAHKANALQLVRELGLEEPKQLAEHIIFYNAENTNVFVGAFASKFAGPSPARHSFPDFLNTIAPYHNERELIAFLKTKHIEAERMEYSQEHNIEFNHIFGHLIESYEQDSLMTGRSKDRILVRHEAQQLTCLHLDNKRGERSVFVTADKRLQRVVQASGYLDALSANVLSHIGFIGLVDLLIGLTPDKEVFTRLVWATPRNTVQKQLRDYLVKITLRRYDDAMAMAMPTVLDEVLAIADLDTLSQRRIGNATDIEEAKKTTEFLDRIENKYFEKMRAAVEKLEKDNA